MGFSPYANGSYLVSTPAGTFEEYILYCSCESFARPSRWRGSEVRTCEVSDSAYHRGYGSQEEVTFLSDEPRGVDDIPEFSNLKQWLTPKL